MSTDIKLSKAQISKIIQSEQFLGSSLSKLAGPLMKVAVPLARNILAPLEITAAVSAVHAEIQKKVHGSGTTTSIISNEEINNVMKFVQVLEDSNILLKRITKAIENKTKERNAGFLGMLLGASGASLLVNMLTEKGILRAVYGSKKNNSNLSFKKL